MSENPFAILTREPVPDSRLDGRAVIARGRARMRRRRGLTAVAAGLAVAVVAGAVALARTHPEPKPAPVGPSPACVPEPMPQLGPTVRVTIDPSGRYIAATPDSLDGTVLLAGPGGVRTLTAVPRLVVSAVNGGGTVVGNVEHDADEDGYVIDGGTAVELGRPPGALNAGAHAVGENGDVAGDVRMPDNTFRAVVWRHGHWDQPQLLTAPPGQSGAFGIAADGRIVGSVGTSPQPYLWQPDGTGAPLPTPDGKPGGIATDIVGDWAAGPVDYAANATTLPNGRPAARPPLTWARWNLRTGEVRALTGGPRTVASGGLLADGTVVLQDVRTATLWTEAGATELPVPDGFTRWLVTGASAGGVLVGPASDDRGWTATYRWACR